MVELLLLMLKEKKGREEEDGQSLVEKKALDSEAFE